MYCTGERVCIASVAFGVLRCCIIYLYLITYRIIVLIDSIVPVVLFYVRPVLNVVLKQNLLQTFIEIGSTISSTPESRLEPSKVSIWVKVPK